MHLTCEPAPLEGRCHAPIALCNLVAAMLAKEPVERPTASEVRDAAREIAQQLSQAYEEFELNGLEIEIEAELPPRQRGRVRADELEFGATEMLPVVRKPRWTPEIGRVSSMFAAQQPGTIAPRAPRDQVAGEIVLTNKPR